MSHGQVTQDNRDEIIKTSVKVLDLDDEIHELHGVNFLIKQLKMLSFVPIQNQA